MTFFDKLNDQTRLDAERFMSINIIQDAIENGVEQAAYLAFLTQAYHHVKLTCPLLGLALSRCTSVDKIYRNALIEYIDEEKGHEEWILNDIEYFGGDRKTVEQGKAAIPTQVMCGYAHYAIEHLSPYALLGMVHVLEGMSVALATTAAGKIYSRLNKGDGQKGFSYLLSHGSLDVEHTNFFAQLVNQIEEEEKQNIIIQSAKIFYRLYGDIFRELEIQVKELSRAA